MMLCVTESDDIHSKNLQYRRGRECPGIGPCCRFKNIKQAAKPLSEGLLQSFPPKMM
jgi:hypothetical protein